MNDYEVTLSIECTYTISAPNESVAIDIASEYFQEAVPAISVEKIKNEE